METDTNRETETGTKINKNEQLETQEKQSRYNRTFRDTEREENGHRHQK